jgi:hypothetical protein
VLKTHVLLSIALGSFPLIIGGGSKGCSSFDLVPDFEYV